MVQIKKNYGRSSRKTSNVNKSKFFKVPNVESLYNFKEGGLISKGQGKVSRYKTTKLI